jgi:hypothetical protein
MSYKSYLKLENSLKQSVGSNSSKKRGNKDQKKFRNKVIRQTPNHLFDKSIAKRYFDYEF